MIPKRGFGLLPIERLSRSRRAGARALGSAASLAQLAAQTDMTLASRYVVAWLATGCVGSRFPDARSKVVATGGPGPDV
ncbi:MAG: hypothetical protein R2735_04375 [Microthrixaceae bacterium]